MTVQGRFRDADFARKIGCRDAAARMPNLQALASQGASGTAVTELPSLSNPGRATLSTGAPPEVHGVTNNSRFSPPPVDSIISLAHERGVPVTVYGSYFWRSAFGDYLEQDRLHSFNKRLGSSPGSEALERWPLRLPLPPEGLGRAPRRLDSRRSQLSPGLRGGPE